MRWYTPELESRPKAHSAGLVDMVVADCHNVMVGPDGVPDPDNAFRAASILISLSTDDAVRYEVHQLRNALRFARTTTHTIKPNHCASELRARLSSHRMDSVNIVIYDDSRQTWTTLRQQSLIDSVLGSVRTALARVVIVSAHSHAWSEVRCVAGLVRGVAVTDIATAAITFLMVATLMAPRTLTCMDFEDFGFPLDPASGAGVLAQALWFREGKRLVCASLADEETVVEARWVAALPLLGRSTLNEVHEVAQAVRKMLSNEAYVRYAAPAEFEQFSYIHSRTGTIYFLCQRPTPTSS